MRLRGKLKIGILVTGFGCLALLLLGWMQYRYTQDAGICAEHWHHKLATDADTQIGSLSVPDDHLVDERFTSHLPLVVIDTHGQKIGNYKVYDPQTQSFICPEGVDPYVDMEISLIDHPDRPNTLGDPATTHSYGRIKIRGNNSASYIYPKMQYLLKLEDREGEKNSIRILGMEPSDTWVLNGTMRDKSNLRNYLAFNLAKELDPFTPDIRMCEVVLKGEQGYEYLGLYGMMEKVERGAGRLDIPAVSNPATISDRSYILKRDRQDLVGLSMAVWTTEHNDATNWLSLEYPTPQSITPEYWEYIQGDIHQLEDALYSDDKRKFIGYRSMLDLDSFVDYFILNEFLCNYDAGRNSTYLYKNTDDRIAIGPVWDFDNALDNEQAYMTDLRTVDFVTRAWFDRMVRDDYFNQKLVKRYRALREGLLSDERLEQVLEDASAYLRRPASRDRSRWNEVNPHILGTVYDENAQCLVRRDQDTWEEEVEKMEQCMLLHGEYLDKNLAKELDRYRDDTPLMSAAGGVLLITAFFVSIILVLRVRKGE